MLLYSVTYALTRKSTAPAEWFFNGFMSGTYEQQLEQLREEYKTATMPRREAITLQGKCLKLAIDVRDKRKTAVLQPSQGK